jgi:hypothetical protein
MVGVSFFVMPAISSVTVHFPVVFAKTKDALRRDSLECSQNALFTRTTTGVSWDRSFQAFTFHMDQSSAAEQTMIATSASLADDATNSIICHCKMNNFLVVPLPMDGQLLEPKLTAIGNCASSRDATIYDSRLSINFVTDTFTNVHN